ncbi:hypothetical protein PF005_g24374 [Phytophthora fragariae]|uniref:Secreted protein n=1 Tax=Phytophthora fragariae TaxID=53985 RepID=A0A6A3E4R3_9STRA|nr:hypothetical protein PF009_g24971 [Phytophthora fragariae]KAE8979440.1 hypothetical protein PF011_g22851 [Phytophthora fragariae]KAE9077254.1 hypothetical protein PF010_g23583 [Phytophthora fragariae]KAE9078407.1 hypothetical protein PF007_g23874 [Phytophthora fragariae]KAE9097943.1 hypothetical protein PF006_g23467 [Phytophthora fragariae]
MRPKSRVIMTIIIVSRGVSTLDPHCVCRHRFSHQKAMIHSWISWFVYTNQPAPSICPGKRTTTPRLNMMQLGRHSWR